MLAVSSYDVSGVENVTVVYIVQQMYLRTLVTVTHTSAACFIDEKSLAVVVGQVSDAGRDWISAENVVMSNEIRSTLKSMSNLPATRLIYRIIIQQLCIKNLFRCPLSSGQTHDTYTLP